MEVPIIVSYRWSADELLLLNRLHMRYSPQMRKLRRSVRSGAIIFLAMGVLCFCAVGMTPEKRRLFAYGCALVFAGVLFLAGMPFLLWRAALRAYARKPDRDLVVTYKISEERLSCSSDVASSDMLWRTILKALRTVDGFLLYLSDTQVHWLPVRGFQNPVDVDRLARLAKERVENYNDEREPG